MESKKLPTLGGDTTRGEVGFLHRGRLIQSVHRGGTRAQDPARKEEKAERQRRWQRCPCIGRRGRSGELKRGWRNLPEKTPQGAEVAQSWDGAEGRCGEQLVPQVGQWLVQFRDWRLCWCAECRSPVEQKFCNRKLREKRLRSCWIIKLAGKDGPNLNFWVKACVAIMLTREEDFALATFQKEVKSKQRRAMQSSSVSNRGVNRKSKLLPQFQPEVAIVSSSYCRSIQGGARECVVACACLCLHQCV